MYVRPRHRLSVASLDLDFVYIGNGNSFKNQDEILLSW